MLHITTVDHMHVLRQRAIHRLMARALRRDGDVVMELTREALRDQVARDGVEEPFHKAWAEILSMPRDKIANLLIQRSDRMDVLRSSSPFMRLFGYDVGANQRIDFQDEAIRRRLWAMGKRLVKRSPIAPMPTTEA